MWILVLINGTGSDADVIKYVSLSVILWRFQCSVIW
jgi:hypothetical protein